MTRRDNTATNIKESFLRPIISGFFVPFSAQRTQNSHNIRYEVYSKYAVLPWWFQPVAERLAVLEVDHLAIVLVLVVEMVVAQVMVQAMEVVNEVEGMVGIAVEEENRIIIILQARTKRDPPRNGFK
jgi:hypothetical protein